MLTILFLWLTIGLRRDIVPYNMILNLSKERTRRYESFYSLILTPVLCGPPQAVYPGSGSGRYVCRGPGRDLPDLHPPSHRSPCHHTGFRHRPCGLGPGLEAGLSRRPGVYPVRRRGPSHLFQLLRRCPVPCGHDRRIYPCMARPGSAVRTAYKVRQPHPDICLLGVSFRDRPYDCGAGRRPAEGGFIPPPRFLCGIHSGAWAELGGGIPPPPNGGPPPFGKGGWWHLFPRM